MILPTPYENEQGDWWIAVEDVASQETAREAVEMVAYSPVEFVAVVTATLMEGEYGDALGFSRHVPAYHFREITEQGNVENGTSEELPGDAG